MFVLNLKFNFKKIIVMCIGISIVFAVLIEFISNGAVLTTMRKDTSKYDFVMTNENFTTVLKQVHENVASNVNKTISVTGFVYRMTDFKENMFVCGRNTIINEEDNVAGFICDFKDAVTLKDGEWVEITGIFNETNYNGSMPIIKVGNIRKVTAPANTFVK